jgi:hypothetical protein
MEAGDRLYVDTNVLNQGWRVKGSHHIFTRDGIDEILNVQPKGTMA